MIDLYFSPTPNGHKIKIMLYETGLAFRVIDVEALDDKHFNPEFLRISPGNKMPAIVDHDPGDGSPPLSLFESGAILIYLAEKTGCFLPVERAHRAATLAWLMWQVSALGPMSGQNGHFRHHAPDDGTTYAAERYAREVGRLYAVLDYRLSASCFVAGEDLSIADLACHPWIAAHAIQGIDLAEYPHLRRWQDALAERPAFARAYAEDPAYGPSPRLADAEHRRRYRQTADMLRKAYSRAMRA